MTPLDTRYGDEARFLSDTNGHKRVVSYILVIDIKNERRDPDRKQV